MRAFKYIEDTTKQLELQMFLEKEKSEREYAAVQRAMQTHQVEKAKAEREKRLKQAKEEEHRRKLAQARHKEKAAVFRSIQDFKKQRDIEA